MSRRSARYDSFMYLQNYTVTRTPSKQLVKSWYDEEKFAGRIESAYKAEETIGGVRDSQVPQVASVAQFWVYLRYRTDVRFSPTKRIRFDDRVFDIISALDLHGQRRELKVLCREVQT